MIKVSGDKFSMLNYTMVLKESLPGQSLDPMNNILLNNIWLPPTVQKHAKLGVWLPGHSKLPLGANVNIAPF